MRQNQRGIALITVLLVLLVLTALGITASMLMTQEDRTSSRQDLFRVALYAAEAGLRHGEAELTALSSNAVSSILGHLPQRIQGWTGSPTDSSNLPTQPTVKKANTWTINNLGTYLSSAPATVDPSQELVNQVVLMPSGVGGNQSVFFTLYVRNNPDDVAALVTTDTDQRLRLVSVGFVTDGAANLSGNELTGNYKVLAVKVIEEEIFFKGGQGAGVSVQKQVNTGGTGSITYSGNKL